MDLLCSVACLQIGEDVGSTETVDRLLGVANIEEWVITTGIDATEDAVLYRVGILKLVDQCRLVALAQGMVQLTALRLQCLEQIAQ